MRGICIKLIFAVAVATVLPLTISAFTIGAADESFDKSILLTPAKIELEANPGDVKIFYLEVSNNLDKESSFKVEVKDVVPSKISNDVLEIVEDRETSFGKQFLYPELGTFTLGPNEKITLPIEFRIPVSADHGGYHSTILITQDRKSTEAAANVRVRLGAIVLMKVGTDIDNAGLLSKFQIRNDKKVFFKGNVPLAFTFVNSGNVHLNPYGGVSVNNLFSSLVETHEVRPWFVLPESTRTNSSVEIDTSWKFGKYEILLELNRGYGNRIDRDTVSVWIFSWQWVSILIIVLLIILGLRRRMKSYGDKSARSEVLIFIYILGLLIALSFVIALSVKAERASSLNYILERDSINIGGGLSTSTNYALEDTVGEVGTGRGTSANYILDAGYQQLDDVILTITAPADVSLSPDISSSSGGQADGSAAWTVVTNSSGGYTLAIKASASPAMVLLVGGDNFADYTVISSGVPDYTWGVDSGTYEFGYSPDGTDITSTYKDNGSACNMGSSITNTQCWEGFTTSNVTIASAASGNYPGGLATTVNFRAEANGSTPTTGNYQAVLTLTALAL